MAFRREVFGKHRFSEFFTGYSQGEDMEMGLRVSKEWNILWCGDARVIHEHARTSRPNACTKGFMEVRNHFFIWRRHVPNASLLDRVRFWVGLLLLLVFDIGHLMTRPWRTYLAGHALGVVRGIMSCILSPPVYEEPIAQQEYLLEECSHPEGVALDSIG
jgi:hypothetical protein